MQRIGIDLGGTKTELIVCTEEPTKVIHRLRVPTCKDSYRQLLDQLVELVNSAKEYCDVPPAIGLGAPGFVYPKTGGIGSSNIQCLSYKPLQEDLSRKLELPVRVANDANCFALSEALFGAGKGTRMVIGVILGTGMGGGMVHDGQIWSGSQGITGEWGHISLDVHGPICYCGRRGCQELYLSGTGIQRMHREKTGNTLSVPEIHDAWENDTESAAGETFELFLDYFGQAIANLVMCLDPDVIVLGGGVSNLPVLYDEGARRTAEQVFRGRQSVRIVQNKLGDSSGVYGAAEVAGS